MIAKLGEFTVKLFSSVLCVLSKYFEYKDKVATQEVNVYIKLTLIIFAAPKKL
jgi:hypothetical protein